MKNRYEVRGDVTVIYLNNGLETTISTEDLDKVNSYPCTWFAHAHRNGTYYVKGKYRGVTYRLHRVITDCPENLMPDHLDRNPLNNTRSNLEVKTNRLNVYNSHNKRNKSGYPGVSFQKATEKWKAQIRIEGKIKYLGIYEKVEDAIEARKKAEKEYLGGIIHEDSNIR